MARVKVSSSWSDMRVIMGVTSFLLKMYSMEIFYHRTGEMAISGKRRKT